MSESIKWDLTSIYESDDKAYEDLKNIQKDVDKLNGLKKNPKENLTDLISPSMSVFASFNILTASACSSSLIIFEDVCSLQISPVGILSLSLFPEALDGLAFAVTSVDLFPLSSW